MWVNSVAYKYYRPHERWEHCISVSILKMR